MGALLVGLQGCAMHYLSEKQYCTGCEQGTSDSCEGCGYPCCINCKVNEICKGATLCSACYSQHEQDHNNATDRPERRHVPADV